jgi:hypothetical protein
MQTEYDSIVAHNQPVGFVQPGDKRVCKLIKSLYGLKQAARAWHFRLTEQLATLGLHPAASEVSLFSGNIPQGWVCVLVYVDDLLLVGVQDAVKSVLDCLSSVFTLSQAGTLGIGEEDFEILEGDNECGAMLWE